jgi:stalled ribosome rescue protein Dom34
MQTPKYSYTEKIRLRDMKPKGYRRGYPVAVLIGVEADHAALWQIYSQVAKPQQRIPLSDRRDQKAVYNFQEAIVNALRPILKEGVRSIIIASPPRTSFGQNLQAHISSHHQWLTQGTNKVTISLIDGSASTSPQVGALTQKPIFKQLIQDNAAEETENLLELLEKRLNDNLVVFSLEEAENLILTQQPPGKPQPEYLLLTNGYLAGVRQKNRIHRLMQIAQNKQIKTRVIDAESAAGVRLTQLGGIVCLEKRA